MPPESPKDRLPFEPRQTRKKAVKIAPSPVPPPIEASRAQTSLQGIPPAVSQRMARRMAVFCGIPTGLGVASFFIFYWIVSHKILEIPSYVAMVVSLSLFGLGFIGLSYGIFSASWDESRVGNWLGWAEFRENFGKTIRAWRSPAVRQGRSSQKEVEEK